MKTIKGKDEFVIPEPMSQKEIDKATQEIEYEGDEWMIKPSDLNINMKK